MWKEYTNAALGLGVAIVAFLGLTDATLMTTLFVLGAAVLVLGLWSASTWQDYTNAALGLGIAVVGLFGLTGAALSWTLFVLGAAVLVLGLWGANTLSSSEFERSHA